MFNDYVQRCNSPNLFADSIHVNTKRQEETMLKQMLKAITKVFSDVDAYRFIRDTNNQI